MKSVKVCPSMMCADFINLKPQLDLFTDKQVDYLHIDVMDGHYVPNFTLGPDYCRALANYSKIPLDIHLMIENIDQYIPVFAKFDNAVVSFHPEVSYHPLRSLQLLRTFPVKCGIAIDPSMTLESVKTFLPFVDMVCVMTVNPGYAGQPLIKETLTKLEAIAKYVDEQKYDIEIQVDGNVSWENIPVMVSAGATMLVTGSSSVFSKAAPVADNLDRLNRMIGKTK